MRFEPLSSSQLKTLEKNLIACGAAYLTALQTRGVIKERSELEGTVARTIEKVIHVAEQLGQPNRDDHAVIDLMRDYGRHIEARVEINQDRKPPYKARIRVYCGL